VDSFGNTGQVDLMAFYTIKEAIRTSTRLRLTVGDSDIVVEPHTLGRDRKGRTLLRAFQVNGSKSRKNASRWRLIDLEHVQRAVEAGDHFNGPRAGYKPKDPRMTGSIIERL
jgi:hypothetical protein